MKLARIKWSNHPILGDLELDFTKKTTGEPYSNVLFAGENGAGKSTVLESISGFLNAGPYEGFEYVEYVVGDELFRTAKPSDGTTHQNFFDLVNSSGEIRKIRSDRNNNRDIFQSDTGDLRYYGCVYSKARSDYKTKKITATTISQLDYAKHDTDEAEDFTSLKQLIVDVVNQDNSDYSEGNRARGQSPQSWDDFYLSSKLFRFKNAFDNFFDKLKYKGVADIEGEKTIFFQKNGRSIQIDKLSTGEKQIVFRGIFLLRNSYILDGAAILIDEPELSMHPKWERRILRYYKDLFDQGGRQRAQIFFATHSDHVLREALSDETNNLVIVLEDVGGSIQSKKIDAPSVLPSITTAETTYLAFDVISNDYHIELYGWLQDKHFLGSVKSCDEFIRRNALYVHGVHSKPSGFGNTTYETLSTYIRNAIHHPDSGNTFTEAELRCSIELLIELCR